MPPRFPAVAPRSPRTRAGGHGWRVAGRQPADDAGNLREGHTEDVVQHERYALGRRQALEHRQHRLALRFGSVRNESIGHILPPGFVIGLTNWTRRV